MKFIIPRKLEQKVHSLSTIDHGFKFRLDDALYLLNQIIYGTNNKESLLQNGWVALCSSILRKTIGKNANKYTSIFLKNNIIEKMNYCTDCNTCNRFRINEDWVSEDEHVEFEINNWISIRRLTKNRIMESATKKFRHLWKWFDNPKFTIDLKTATQELQLMQLEEGKKRNVFNAINNLKNGNKWFLRHERDKRLHTNITNLKSEMRKHLRYDNKKLKNIDIINSQPFFLLVLLQDILNTKPRYNLTMLEQMPQPLCLKELKRYGDLVLSGTFYKKMGIKLISENGRNGLYEKRRYCKIYKSNISSFYHLDEPKKLMKSVTFEVLFSKNSTQSPEKKWFKQVFPTIMNFIEQIKEENHRDLSILLQNIEAEAILEVATRRINKLNSEVPLFTIHDSIMTTEENLEFVHKILEESIVDMTGFKPPLKIEE